MQWTIRTRKNYKDMIWCSKDKNGGTGKRGERSRDQKSTSNMQKPANFSSLLLPSISELSVGPLHPALRLGISELK